MTDESVPELRQRHSTLFRRVLGLKGNYDITLSARPTLRHRARPEATLRPTGETDRILTAFQEQFFVVDTWRRPHAN